MDERFQGTAKLADGAEDGLLAGALPQSQMAADLGDGPALEVAQDERRPLHGAQLAERGAHRALDLLAQGGALRPRLGGRERLRLFQVRFRASLPHELDRRVDRDAMEPGPEPGAGVEAVERAVGAQEGLLDRV